MTVLIDTYGAVKKLTEDKAFSKKQAERIVEVIGEANEQVATKQDIQLLKRDMALLKRDLVIAILGTNGVLFTLLKYLG